MTTGRYAEDLDGNLRLVERLAPVHCTACGSYHLARARKRLQPDYVDMLDRAAIMALVRSLALARLTGGSGGLDLLIAGNADTNLLSTCAEALSSLDPNLSEQVHYTAIDRCQTPLELCRAYADHHDLALRTARVDMTAGEIGFSADLILLHSLLRFAPLDRHVAIMRRLRGWLCSGGTIVFSHRLMAEDAPERLATAHVAEYQTSAQLRTLFAAAGLRIVSMDEMDEGARGTGRHRVLAALAAE